MLLQQFILLFPLCAGHLLLGVWKKYWQKSNHFIRYFIILQTFKYVMWMRSVLVANLRDIYLKVTCNLITIFYYFTNLQLRRGNIRIQHLIQSSGGTLPHLRATSSAGGGSGSGGGHQSLKTCRQVSNAATGGGGSLPRFPRLQDCAHFHYEFTELGHLSVRRLKVVKH